MGIWISGYLPEGNLDEFIKYECDIEEKFNNAISSFLGNDIFKELCGGMWPLSKNQAFEISKLIERSLPSDLDLFISIVSE